MIPCPTILRDGPMNRQLVVRSPALLCLSVDNNLRPTMRFLLEELGMDRTTLKQVRTFMLEVACSFMCETLVLWYQCFLSSRWLLCRFRISYIESSPFERTFHMCSFEETRSTQYFKARYAVYSNTRALKNRYILPCSESNETARLG